jgi:hypothetical protein
MIANAGIIIVKRLFEISVAEWDKIMEVLVPKCTFLAMGASLTHYKPRSMSGGCSCVTGKQVRPNVSSHGHSILTRREAGR